MSMDVDWTAPRTDRLLFEQVDPFDLSVRGPVTGVVPRGCTLTWDADADISPIASLELHGSSWDGDGMVRVTHVIEDAGYSRVLGTFFAVDDGLVLSRGKWGGQVSAQGPMCALAADLWECDHMVPDGCSCLEAVADCCAHSYAHLRVEPGASDRALTAAQVWPAGETVASCALELAERAGCELVDGADGTLVLRRRRDPALSAPVERLYPVGELAATSSLSLPSRAVARVSLGGDQVSVAYADAAPWHPASAQRRGRRVTVLVSSDTSDGTPATASMAAADELERALSEPCEWRFRCLYAPVSIGDVVVFKAANRDVVGWVSAIDLSLAPGMPMDVGVKEV